MIDAFSIRFRRKHFPHDFFIFFVGFGEQLMKDVLFDFEPIRIGKHIPVAKILVIVIKPWEE